MSIESKAYPRQALCFASCETCKIPNGCERKKEWVPLVDAQKEIEKALEEQAKAIHEDWNRAGREWHEEECELKVKIEAFKQQQKDDYATYQAKVSELQNTISEANDIAMGYKAQVKALEAKIEATNKILDAYCKDSDNIKCSRFVKGECTLKLPKSCFVKSIRDALLIPRNRDQKPNFSLPLKAEITATENVFKKRKEECNHTFEKQEIGKGNPPMFEMVCSKCGIWECYVKKENTTP